MTWSSKNEAKRHRAHLKPGSRGVFVTSGSYGTTRKAVIEFLHILNNFAPRVDSEPSAADAAPSSAAEGDVDSAVAAELEELKSESTSKRFAFVPDVTKGVSYMRFNDERDDPAAICHAVLRRSEDRTTQPRVSCRYLCKLIPVEMTCKPHEAEFQEMMRVLIAAHFPRSRAAIEAAAAKTKKADAPTTASDAADAAGAAGAADAAGVAGEGGVSTSGTAVGVRADADKPAAAVEETSNKAGEKRQLDRTTAATATDSDAKRRCNAAAGDAPIAAAGDAATAAGDAPPAAAGDAPPAAAGDAAGGSGADSSGEIMTWAVQYNVRHGMKTLPRAKVCDIVGDLVGAANYKVNLTAPQMVVLVEVSPVICGASVCKDYFELAKYNIHRLCNPEARQDKATDNSNKEEQAKDDS